MDCPGDAIAKQAGMAVVQRCGHLAKIFVFPTYS